MEVLNFMLESLINFVQKLKFKTVPEVKSKWIDVLIGNKLYRIRTFHRSHSQDLVLDFAILNEIQATYSVVQFRTIIKDFNFPDIDWCTLASTYQTTLLFIDDIANKFLIRQL